MSKTKVTPNSVAFSALQEVVKVGNTKLKVLFVAERGVHGAETYWNDEMRGNVGKELTVRDSDASSNEFQLSDDFWYPAISLFAEPKQPVEVSLPDYTATVYPTHLQVGYQEITKEMVLAIVKGGLDTGFLSTSDLEGLNK